MTFSITGFCKKTGMVGVAITTSSICVASRCPWVRAGVGAASTQNITDPTVSMSYPLKQARENFEKNYLLNQLRKNKGNISKTAEFIGMERSALHRKLKSLGIKGIN